MPTIINGDFRTNVDIAVTEDYGYEYPNGLDLRPGQELHSKILSYVLERAIQSSGVISQRFTSWDKIKNTLTAYIPLDEKEQKSLTKDERYPVSIVVPFSYATLHALLAHWAATFLEMPILRYEPVDPSDTLGAILLEKIVELQCLRNKVSLGLYIQARDALTYGFGAVAVTWDKQMGRKPNVVQRELPRSLFDMALGKPAQIEELIEWADVVKFEGNRVSPISPYNILLDTNVPIHEFQRGEYVGYISRSNYTNLLSDEIHAGRLFNIRYLQGSKHTSTMYHDMSADGPSSASFSLSSTKEIDVIWMYCTIIPKDLDLGPSENPEKWMFGVAGDSVVISAYPMNLEHQMFPISICAPDFDGYSTTPTSRVEVTYGLQHVVDAMINTMVAQAYKIVRNRIIYDPMRLDSRDVEADKVHWRTLPNAFTQGNLDSVAKQLDVHDLSAGHMSTVGFLFEVLQRVSGATDSLQGMTRKHGERVSATEADDVRSSALGRLDTSARIASIQSLHDLGYLFASHTQQFMSQNVMMKSTGRWADVLINELGMSPQGWTVSPRDIAIDYDVVSGDISGKTGQNMNSLLQMFQTVLSDPVLRQANDIVRLSQHVFREMGVKNPDQFLTRQPIAQVLPDEQVQNMAQQGNIVPMGEPGL